MPTSSKQRVQALMFAFISSWLFRAALLKSPERPEAVTAMTQSPPEVPLHTGDSELSTSQRAARLSEEKKSVKCPSGAGDLAQQFSSSTA